MHFGVYELRQVLAEKELHRAGGAMTVLGHDDVGDVFQFGVGIVQFVPP